MFPYFFSFSKFDNLSGTEGVYGYWMNFNVVVVNTCHIIPRRACMVFVTFECFFTINTFLKKQNK